MPPKSEPLELEILDKLIFFVEELSMETALKHLLPKMLKKTEFQIIRFQCKDDLLKNLHGRLKGYCSWMPNSWRIVVLVDRDDDDCILLKQKLEKIASDADATTKTVARQGQHFQVVNRIVIEELEAWFFGDWQAVQTAYPKVPPIIPQKSGFRDSDAIQGGTWEALERVLKKAGYFQGGLRKLECAGAIAQHMEINRNTSKSFQTFFSAL
jgi:hypothetical protein